MQNLAGRNRTCHGEPDPQSPTHGDPAHGAAAKQPGRLFPGSRTRSRPRKHPAPRAWSCPAPVCCKALMPFQKVLLKQSVFQRRVFTKVLLLSFCCFKTVFSKVTMVPPLSALFKGCHCYSTTKNPNRKALGKESPCLLIM